MAGLGLAKKVGLTALGLGTGGAAGNIESNLHSYEILLLQFLIDVF